MRPITILVMILTLLAGKYLWAQETDVSGQVVDAESGDPVVGVNILVQETNSGTTTDLEGRFSLSLSEEAKTLIFRFVGYQEKKRSIDKSSEEVELTVELEETQVGLDEVVVSASKHEEKVLDAPASISVLNADEIEEKPVTSPVDHLEEVEGVDIMKTGIISSNVNIRGFNNIFSGAMLTIVDNRIGRVPSLRANIFQLIPSNNYDIERIEVVRGPASALYGPNANSGVMHIITKSPLDIKDDFETIVSLAGGERSTINPEFWHAGKISDKFGYKISGSYTQGHDWRYYDPREPEVGDTVVFGTVKNGQLFQPDTVSYVNENGVDTTRLNQERFDRDFFIRRYSADARLDFRPIEDMQITLSGGFANTSNIELSGLGAAQTINWKYIYGQARLNYKNLFAQYFINTSDAGDTYLIPQSGNEMQYLNDKSRLHGAQIQHSWRPTGNLSLTYGFDFLGTRPKTNGTINGRFEDEDNINQYGGYLQADYDLTEQLKFLATSRLDYHSVTEKPVVSPRGAIVYKPDPSHTIRATYNRAFSTPTTLNFFLDLPNGRIPNGINIRGIGNADGYEYRRTEDGTPQYISPYDSSWHRFNNTDKNHIFMDEIMNQLASSFGNEILTNIVYNGLYGKNGKVNDVSQVLVDYVQLRETGSVEKSKMSSEGMQDIEAVKSSIKQTVEIGYKGLAFDKLQLNADFYYSRTHDYISPLTTASGSVIMDPDELLAKMGTPDEGLLRDNLDNIPSSLRQDLIDQVDNDPDLTHPKVPNISGSAWDEMAAVLLQANEGLTAGTVTPDDEKVNQDVIITYINLGTIDIAGSDLGFTYRATDNISIKGSYSFVNKDRIPLEGASDGYVALNAPKHKTSLSVNHQIPKWGLSYYVNWRWQDGYPANSAVYVGHVDPANYLDVGISYSPSFSPNTTLSVDVSNLLDYKHQRFPGTPEIGRMTMAKLSHRF